MQPGRNDLLREELGQYVEASVGNVVEEHPAFEYSTDSERDNHEIDFEALKLYRDSNFDILKRDSQNPLERWVEAFVNEDLYADEKHGENFHYNDTEAPRSYSTEKWLNADTVEEALDLGHGLVLTIGNPINVPEHAAVTREAYKRYHDLTFSHGKPPIRAASPRAASCTAPTTTQFGASTTSEALTVRNQPTSTHRCRTGRLSRKETTIIRCCSTPTSGIAAT
ncbi:hypothetical protein [Halosegnis longus]|nr:hypothetical protein [Halosegnis longus]